MTSTHSYGVDNACKSTRLPPKIIFTEFQHLAMRGCRYVKLIGVIVKGTSVMKELTGPFCNKVLYRSYSGRSRGVWGERTRRALQHVEDDPCHC